MAGPQRFASVSLEQLAVPEDKEGENTKKATKASVVLYAGKDLRLNPRSYKLLCSCIVKHMCFHYFLHSKKFNDHKVIIS